PSAGKESRLRSLDTIWNIGLYTGIRLQSRIMKTSWRLILFAGVTGMLLGEANPTQVLTGPSAFVTSSGIQPGTFRKITAADLPKPFMTESATLRSRIVPRPAGTMPKAPAGFQVGLFADGLRMPRVIRVAPNGDIFLAETQAGQVRVFRGI